MTPHATIDFETRSACNLRACGSWRYSLDPTTEALCLAYRLPHWEAGRTALWHSAFPQIGLSASLDTETLRELFQWILAGHAVEAHNAWFERGIWRNVMQVQYGWVGVSDTQWRCSAAKAAAHALPRHLDDALAAMQLKIRKDEEGGKVMRKVSSPRDPRKAELVAWARQHAPCADCKATGKHKVGRAKATPCGTCQGLGYNGATTIPPMPRLWHESKELFATLFAYCQQDVLAEEALSKAVPDLSPEEQALYCLDQQVNETGVYIDQSAVQTALHLITGEVGRLNAELRDVTGGAVERATQRIRLRGWLESEGIMLMDTQKHTVADLLEEAESGEEIAPWICRGGQMSAPAKRALTILQELGRSSTAKYEAMRNWVCPDSRVHGSLLFHGASTGRWSGAGIQPQNFPKGEYKDWDMELAWEFLKTTPVEIIREYWGSVLGPLSQALRGAITASPGMHLFVADYASIEARVLLWLAGETEALGLFRSGGDIYCDMASDIYQYPCAKATHPKERALGKVAVLGLGYQMGPDKFRATAALAGIDITDDFAQLVVDTYRTKYAGVKQLWYEQEDAMVMAITKARPVVCAGIRWHVHGRFLYATLPSGRRLAYPFPGTRMTTTPWGSQKLQPTFMGINPYNHQWQRQSTYGGMIVENLVQAISRDIMAEAMKRLAKTGVYRPVLTVHDELVTEAHPVLGDVEQFVHLVAEVPTWAAGCPIDAEGWTGVRYRK